MKRLWSFINTVNFSFWNRVVRSTCANSQSLSVYRILIGLFLIINSIKSLNWIADVPQAFFNPPKLSLANLLSGFPDRGFLMFLDLLIAVSLVCLTFGIRAKLATLVFVIVSIVGNSFLFSFGKIDHSITIYLLLFCLSFSGWGAHLSLVPDKPAHNSMTMKSLSLFSVCLCFAMFTAGFEKSMNWVDFDLATSGFMSWYNQGYYSLGRQELLAPYVGLIPIFFLEYIDYSAVVFELSPFLFLLWSRKAWRVWLFIACCFHLSVALMLNIFFTFNVLAYLVFIDYSKAYNRAMNVIKAFPGKNVVISAWTIALLLIIIKLVFVFGYSIQPFASFFSLGSSKYFAIVFITFGIIFIGNSTLSKSSLANNSST